MKYGRILQAVPLSASFLTGSNNQATHMHYYIVCLSDSATTFFLQRESDFMGNSLR